MKKSSKVGKLSWSNFKNVWPKRQVDEGYKRPPMGEQNFVKDITEKLIKKSSKD